MHTNLPKRSVVETYTETAFVHRMPSTRYMGSKRKLLPPLHAVFSTIEFDTVIDPFCGSGAVAYLLKSMGKEVIASDALRWNAVCTRALLSNQPLSVFDTVQQALNRTERSPVTRGFIERHFENIFFTQAENCFLDRFLSIVATVEAPQQDVLLYTLFQAALAKRPYNLFHRANLYMRTSDVKRSFGNKATWDTPFDILMQKQARQLDDARFDSGRRMTVLQQRVEEADLSQSHVVYLDPPYISGRGAGVDYLDYYHFLEGMALLNHRHWEGQLLTRYKHKPMAGRGENPWCQPNTILKQFEQVIARCESAAVVISYRNDGIPSIDQLVALLRRYKKTVHVTDCGPYVYALSKNNRSKEMILTAR